ncbi:MAG: hypothetical protein JXA73_02095 [Acidobacteria bacterium]|nr:hypothetical protein [Acidobacteriota bacterium]
MGCFSNTGGISKEALSRPATGSPQESGSPELFAGREFRVCSHDLQRKDQQRREARLEFRFILYGNGKEVFRSEPETVDLGNITDFKRIPLKIRLRLKDSLPPGDYVLLLQVTDRQANKKYNLASQSLNFKATER